MEKKKTNTKFIIILTVLVLVGGTYGITKYLHSQAHEETDDAQIEKKMNPIIPRVSGYISKVYVKDNDFVKKGDTLFTIDKRDYQLKIDEANAALLGAEGQYEASKADIGSANASISVSDAQMKSATGSIESAKIRLRQITNDYNRYNNLYNNEAWVVANFKETQLNKMVIGQKVSLKVDAYPNYEFKGTVTSFSPATGSRFSLLPPDNATGNFVKTIQRLPVKISLDESNDPEKVKLLRPGMNVDVDVHLK